MVQIAISPRRPRGPPPDRVVPSLVATRPRLLLQSTCLCPPPPTPRPARFPTSTSPHPCAAVPEKLSRPSATDAAASSAPPSRRASGPVRPRSASYPPIPTRHAVVVSLSLLLAACRPAHPALSGAPWPRAAPAGVLNAPRIAGSGFVLRRSWVLACRVSCDRCGSMFFRARIDSVLSARFRASS